MRDCEVSVVEGEKLETDCDAWHEVASDTFHRLTVCEFGLAEEVIGLIEYDSGMFEVGIGETLRPYEIVYFGNDWEFARTEFWRMIQLHTGMKSYEEEHDQS